LRRVKKIIARHTKLKAIPILKVTTASMFFSTEIRHITNELRQKKDLGEYLGIKEEEAPKECYVYAFLSKSA